MNLELPARYRPEDLERLLNERFRRITAALSKVQVSAPTSTSSGGGTGTGGGGTGTIVLSQSTEILMVNLANGPGVTLVASATNATAGAWLAVEIGQGPLGGMQIVWSVQFAAGTGVDIAMGGNEKTRKLFLGKEDGRWHEWTSMGA